MDTDTGLLLGAFVVCLVFSAFFSAAETSLISLSKVRVRSMVEEGKPGAKTVEELLRDPERLINVILVGNNIANIAGSALATAVAMALFGSAGVAIATGVVTVLVLVCSEITPKSLALRRAESVSRFVARPLRLFSYILYPISWVMQKVTGALVRLLLGKSRNETTPTITEEELISMVNVSHEEGVLEREETQMIHNVFEFGDSEISQVMTPRIHVITLPLDADYNQVLEVLEENQFSRMPVLRPDGQVAGFVHIKDILLHGREGFRLADSLRPPHFVYEFNNAAKVFSQMRRGRVPMSIVLDEYGVMVGVVTMEDLIEEVMGDIGDEYDEPDVAILPVGENEYLVDGTLEIGRIVDELKIPLDTEDFESIGGYVLGRLGEQPAEGATVNDKWAIYMVHSVDHNRIHRLKIILKKGGLVKETG